MASVYPRRYRLGSHPRSPARYRGCFTFGHAIRPSAAGGYRLCGTCSCGVHLERSVTPADAEADLLHSALLAFEN